MIEIIFDRIEHLSQNRHHSSNYGTVLSRKGTRTSSQASHLNFHRPTRISNDKKRDHFLKI